MVTRIKSQNGEDDLKMMEMRRKIHTVVHLLDIRNSDGDSLLHLSVMKNNMLKSQQNLFEIPTEAPRLTRFHLTRISLQHGFGLGTRKFA